MIREVPDKIAKAAEEEQRAEFLAKERVRQEETDAKVRAKKDAENAAIKLQLAKAKCYQERKPQGCIEAAMLVPSEQEFVKLLEFGITLNSGMSAASLYYALSKEGKVNRFNKAAFYLSKVKALLIPECEAMAGDYCKALNLIAEACDPSNLDCKAIQLKNATLVAEEKRREEERLAAQRLREEQAEREEGYRQAEERARQERLEEVRYMREERRRDREIEAWKEVGNQLQKNIQQIYQPPSYQQPTIQMPKTTHCNSNGYGGFTCTEY
jgi:hypothetical protein